MPDFTVPYNLAKPFVNSPVDQDLWGGELNTNMDLINAALLANSLATTPTGSVFQFAGAAAPTGYLLCFGQAIDRTTYATLFGIIGTTYGIGNGTTTFNIPDCRGRSAFGKDDMGGSSASRVTNGVSGVDGITLGAVGGDQSQQSHTHTATDSGHTHGPGGGDPNFVTYNPARGFSSLVSGIGVNYNDVTATASGTAHITVSTTGSGASQNMPPAIIFNTIIKT